MRVVTRTSGSLPSCSVVGEVQFTENGHSQADLSARADATFLRRREPFAQAEGPPLRVADLFSGCGAMSLGIAEACRALGYRFEAAAAFEIDPLTYNLYRTNLGGLDLGALNLNDVLAPHIGAARTSMERALRRRLGQVDLVVAGPPCQGHSDLNNRTRRADPKNELYYRVARFVELFEPRHVIIENVSAVQHDRGDVLARTKEALDALGYEISDGVIDAWRLGVPQTRRRHLLLARRWERDTSAMPTIAQLHASYATEPRTVAWALSDLEQIVEPTFLDRPARAMPVTQRRIRWLFEHEAYDLPDKLRPPCHRHGNHTYRAVYGRLRWDRPAPTITGGFETMGRGRFVHPTQQRTLTAHEAARLQFIPDFYDFSPASGRKTALADIIGNAVPPKLSYVAMLELLR